MISAYPAFRALLILLWCFFSLGCFKSKDLLDSIVVLKVNDQPFTAKEFADELSEQLKNLDAVVVKEPLFVDSAKKKVVNNLILQAITRDWAKKNGVALLKDGVNGWKSEVDKIKASYNDDISFRQSLSNEGLSLKEWEAKMRFSLLQKLVIQKVSEQIPEPTAAELKRHYDNNKENFKENETLKIKQIVLSSEADAKRIETELRNRKSFEELAKQFSIAPEGENGGLLGWVNPNDFSVFNAAQKLTAGRRSHIIKSEFGYHIVELIAKRSPYQKPFTEVKDLIRDEIMANRQQAIYAGWLEKQIQLAKVYKNSDAIDKISVVTKGK